MILLVRRHSNVTHANDLVLHYNVGCVVCMACLLHDWQAQSLVLKPIISTVIGTISLYVITLMIKEWHQDLIVQSR